MGRSQQSKARRKARRKNERAAAKRAKAREGQGDPAGNLISGLWNSFPGFGGTKEGEIDGANDSLASKGLRQESDEHTIGDKKPEDEGGWSMWDLVPSFWAGEKEVDESTTGITVGDEENHVDLLSNTKTGKVSAEVGMDGLSAEAEGERSLAMLEMEGMKEGELDDGLYGKIEGGASFMKAEASAKGNLSVNGDGLDAGVEGELGGYIGKAEAKGQLGMKIPFVNAVLTGGGSVEGSLGYGVGGEGHLQAGKDGFSMGGKVQGAMGVGGGFGYSLGMEKADPELGWFDSEAERAYQ